MAATATGTPGLDTVLKCVEALGLGHCDACDEMALIATGLMGCGAAAAAAAAAAGSMA